MKIDKAFIFAFTLMLPLLIYAAPIENVTSSAFMPTDTVHFNLDFADPFGLPMFDVMVKARWTDINQEYTIPLSHIQNDPYYLTTYEGSAVFDTPSSVIEFYGRVEADTMTITQSFKNSSNQFPPNQLLYAPLAADAVGDTMPGSAGEFLDLTGSGITYSDTKIFANLTNVGGGWPRSQGFSTYYIYAIYLGNPDTLTMSVTALVYANIPVVMPPGLYTINLADTTFDQLATIQTQTSGNTLHMACNISDLLTDPNWHTWPPANGYIVTAGITLTMSLSGGVMANDYTYPSVFMPQTQSLRVTPNTSPIMDIPQPRFEINPGISFTAQCYYGDADNNLPVQRWIFFDRGIFPMGSFDHLYSDGALFTHTFAWDPGYHVYFYRFSDGVNTIETDLDSIFISPEGIIDPPAPKSFELSQNYPNPFNSSTKIKFDLQKSSEVDISIFDISGQNIMTLADGRYEIGSHTITWDGRNDAGEPVSSGIYFYRLSLGQLSGEVKKMVLMK